MTGRLLAAALTALCLLQGGALDLDEATPDAAGRVARAVLAATAAGGAAAGGTTNASSAGRAEPTRSAAPTTVQALSPQPTAATARPAAAPKPAAPKPAAAKPAAAAPPAAAKPTAPKATAPKATAPKPTVPKPTAPKPAVAKAKPAGPRADGCDGATGWRERRAARAVAAVRLAPADLGYALVVEPARQGLLGETFRSTRRVVLHVRDCAAQSDADLAWVLAHELAHALDFACGTAESRAAWLGARQPAAAYWPGAGAGDDLASGAGDFAEVFALARTGHRAMWASRLAPAPDAAGLQRLAPLLDARC